jgi:class 3 adenylate cyclase
VRDAAAFRPGPPEAADGALLLADIGGYTSFLRAVATAHEADAFANGAIPDAYAMMSSLLDGIVGQLVPPFIMSKLEGDAVFAYAADPTALPQGAALLDCIRSCYADFRARLEAAHDIWSCRCDACLRIDSLDLKFIVHTGPFVIQQIAGRAELAGPEVVMAHRLLKNDAAERIGHGAYALLTEVVASRFTVPTEGAVSLVARYEHYPPIDTFVFSLRSARTG